MQLVRASSVAAETTKLSISPPVNGIDASKSAIPPTAPALNTVGSIGFSHNAISSTGYPSYLLSMSKFGIHTSEVFEGIIWNIPWFLLFILFVSFLFF